MFKNWTTREKQLMGISAILLIILCSIWFSSASNGDQTREENFIHSSLSEEDELYADHEEEESHPTPTNQVQVDSTADEQHESVLEQEIMIDIKGAVREPYVYMMKEGDRIIDAIDQAGGLLDHASTQPINLAQRLTDGMVIYIPGEDELEDAELEFVQEDAALDGSPSGMDSSSSGKININQADAPALETLPGIGPARAQTIIQYREDHGSFSSIEDLMNVSGIGVKTFENLKDLIES